MIGSKVIFLKTTARSNNKIMCIKVMRALTGFGLKDAKDVIDEIYRLPDSQYFRFSTGDKMFTDEDVHQFRECGLDAMLGPTFLDEEDPSCVVESLPVSVGNHIAKAIEILVNMREFEKAKKLIQFLEEM